MREIIVPIILAAAIIGNTLSVSPIATKALTSNLVTDSTIDSNDLEEAYTVLKQFIAEQKYKGNLAFRLANVYSQEDLRDTEGSIPEPFMDKIVVEYYHPDRESFLKSVYEFMEDNNISEDLVFFIELQEGKGMNVNTYTLSLEETYTVLKQFIAEQKYKGNLAFRLANVYSQEYLKDNEGSIAEPFIDKIVVEYYHPDRENFLKSVYEFMEDNNISEDFVFFIELQEGGVVSTTNLMTLIPDNTNAIPSTTEKIECKGDTNCDGQIDMADAVLVMQSLANPNKYGLEGTAEVHLTEQGKFNGDLDGDGITVGDAQAIQKILLGLTDN